MLCWYAAGCRGAVDRHSGPAVFREKMKDRYGELIVDILIKIYRIVKIYHITITYRCRTACITNCEKGIAEKNYEKNR
jgi:hypothetical protein